MKKNKEKIDWYIGVDVSSETLDVSICRTGQEKELLHGRFSNDVKGFKEILEWLVNRTVSLKQSWFCMEYTGVYSLELSAFLSKKKLKHTMYSPLHIKR